MMKPSHECFYHHDCHACCFEYHEALPDKRCACCGSTDMSVVFDRKRRAAFLAQRIAGVRTADQVEMCST